jgi:methyl-accepting chemotaxis protein
MLQTKAISRPARRISLSVYISLLLIAMALVPLVVTVTSIEILLRPALISQISGDMERDAQTHVQVIDTYLSERLNDVQTLSNAAPVKSLLSGTATNRNTVSDLLFSVFHRDVADYISLSLLSPRGNVILSYPSAPQPHGKYLIQPGISQQIPTSEKVLISDVFYDPLANNPSVDLYARVVNDTSQPIGVLRASLSLHRLWQPVDSETQINGTGSYAFVLDQNGVRIAYTNPDHSGFTHPPYLFKAIQPISDSFKTRIKDANLYGNDANAVTSIDDNHLAQIHNNPQAPLIFQLDPAGQGQTFQVARYNSTVAPWTYFVLRPLSSVTGLADQQLFTIIIIVAVLLILALIIGVRVGRGISLPVMRSVTSLRKNSFSLKTLADEEQVVASEQSWMVEAAQTALQSVKYYTNASSVAVQSLSNICMTLQQRGYNDPAMINRAMSEIIEATRYIDNAIKHQESANEKLASAIRVTTQATNQLTNGARSTDDAATQLEQVVRQLVGVVGQESTSTDEQARN